MLIVRSMLDALRHRGPDDEGVEAFGGATIGARRLAILDLARGHQPMLNETATVGCVQNGEIYNFIDLRKELRARGHRFATDNDTEVLPHAYEEWGLGLFARLRGMFAIAIWDEGQRRLVLARDRFGKKPLVYARFDGGIAFASEIQGLLALPYVSRGIDDAAIAEYLAFGYVPAPRTAFASIRKVEPGHLLVWDAGRLSTERYWRLSFTPKSKIALEEATEELRRRLDESVRLRLISDVPLGALLSGGLDSSTVVAFMARNSDRPVKTFSIGFAERSHDELRYARAVARAFGTEHHEFVVDASDVNVLPLLARHLGEPFADSSIVPTYHVARITRQSVTVALNGDGGDELFAGYDRYKAAALARWTVDRWPKVVAAFVAAAASRSPVPARAPGSVERFRRFLSGGADGREARFLRWTGYFTGPLWESIAGERLRMCATDASINTVRAAADTAGAADPMERYLAADSLVNLPGDLLVKMDIATMANSLEVRSPFLDHELAEFVATLPASYKLSGLTSKLLLRRALRDVLPPAILRRGKMGFVAPVGVWLRGPLRDMFTDLVLAPEAGDRGYVAPAMAERLFRDHVSRRRDHTRWLWSLLMLELWFREVVASSTSREPHAASLRT